MATKNCPKCESANPVACKKCACGHVFFTSRRSANALAAEYEEAPEPSPPQEPELPRRRTARVTRERPQFYDALQVENQTRRQRELQKRRKASKSDDVDASSEDIPEKAAPVASTSSRKHAIESPPAKAAEPPAKKRRGRPPGLTNRRSPRAQILATNKSSDASAKAAELAAAAEDDTEATANIHDVPAVKALQMNLVLSDINFRIANSSVRAEVNVPDDISDEEDSEPAAGDSASVKSEEVKPEKSEASSSPLKKEDSAKSPKSSPLKKEDKNKSPTKKEVEKAASPVKKEAEKAIAVDEKEDEEPVVASSPVKKEVEENSSPAKETEKVSSPTKGEAETVITTPVKKEVVTDEKEEKEAEPVTAEPEKKDGEAMETDVDEKGDGDTDKVEKESKIEVNEPKNVAKEEPMEVDTLAEKVDAVEQVDTQQNGKKNETEESVAEPSGEDDKGKLNSVSENGVEDTKTEGSENIAPAGKEGSPVKAPTEGKSDVVVNEEKVEASTEVAA